METALVFPANRTDVAADNASQRLSKAATETAQSTAETCFDEVVQAHYQKVYNLVYRYLGDAEEACDVTQDVFLRAHQSFQHFRGDAAVYTWLYRIALNLCHNRLKQLNRRYRAEKQSLDAPLEVDGEQLQREWADWSRSPETLAERSELTRALQHAIHSLSPEHRTAVVLRDIEGLSYAEIAEATGCSLEAIKSRLFRARSQLQAVLGPYLTDTVA
jgi:RNA polymerase sigma-70 factor (ECF subfamily)